MLRLTVAVFATFAGISEAACADDGERSRVTTAAAYLAVCPLLTPAPEFASAAARVVNKSSESDLVDERWDKISALKNRALNDLCGEAMRLYGENGSNGSNWLIKKGIVGVSFEEIVAAGDDGLPNSTERQVVSNYVSVAQANRCPGYQTAAAIHIYLAKYGINVRDLEDGGRLQFVYASERLRFLEWFDRNPSSVEGEVNTGAWAAFCLAQIAKFGPDGTIYPNALVEK